MEYVVAVVSNQINTNFIAWSITHGVFKSIEEAENFATNLWYRMCEEDEYTGESVIIHDYLEIK